MQKLAKTFKDSHLELQQKGDEPSSAAPACDLARNLSQRKSKRLSSFNAQY